MRTTNAKRLWPVPATLAVMAVAVLLAFGLMATNGGQPAMAQDAADCTVDVAANGTLTIPTDCSAVGDTAAIKFQGSLAATQDHSVSILIEDKNGPLTIYPNGAGWSTNLDPDGIATSSNGTTAAEPKKYRFQAITIEKRFLNDDGIFEGNAVPIMVQGNVLIWEGETSTHADIADIPTTSSLDGARALVTDSETLDITFLGMPALGEDADTDFNKEVDDMDFDQCVLDSEVTDEDAKLLEEAETGESCGGHPDEPSDESWGVSTAIEDVAEESRSKLVVVTTADGATPMALLDGGKLEIDMGAEDGVTIYAILEDKEQHPLMDTDVTFTATEVPAGIIAASDRMDQEDTDMFGTTTNVTDIAEDDAVATFKLDDLTDVNGAYRITIELATGDLDLGTVILKREGDPETIVAGVFNAACFTPDGTDEDPDYSQAEFNDKNEDCTAMGDAMRFGAGEMLFVKAHLEDSLGSFVGDGTSLDSKLANEDDDLLGDADMLEIEDPVETDDPARAWVYTVDEHATLGDRMITVSSSVEDIDDVMLTVSVAGPPASYMIDGPDSIEIGGSAMFTVTAQDAIEGVPYFGKDPMDMMVAVDVLNLNSSNIRGLMNGMLALDPDTGMGSFEVFAPRDAMDGETIRIFVGSGDLEEDYPVTLGAADDAMPPPDGGVLTSPSGVDAASLSGTGVVSVSWTPGQNATQHWVVLFSLPGYETEGRVEVLNDPDADFHVFRNVPNGEYEVLVASYHPDAVDVDTDDKGFRYLDGIGTVTVD